MQKMNDKEEQSGCRNGTETIIFQGSQLCFTISIIDFNETFTLTEIQFSCLWKGGGQYNTTGLSQDKIQYEPADLDTERWDGKNEVGRITLSSTDNNITKGSYVWITFSHHIVNTQVIFFTTEVRSYFPSCLVYGYKV